MVKKPKLTFDVITLFPSMVEQPLKESIIGRAQQAKRVEIRVHNLRQWSVDARHQKVDDRPFGGGAGMVIQPEPLYRALKHLGGLKKSKQKPWVVFLSPQGKTFNQTLAESLLTRKHMILVCGHYEGIDERVMRFVDQEISLGDMVLTGGEIPALAVIDAVTRLLPGVVGDPESLVNESFSSNSLDYPHYTRPRDWRGQEVPEVLLSGDHKKILAWRREEARKQTQRKRPDLLKEKTK